MTVGLLLVGIGLAVPLGAQAQRATGLIHVTALDPDGRPLSGVMVVTRGPIGTQTQHTGIDGTARFPGLYPGRGYSVTFTLQGFRTVVRDDLDVDAARTTSFAQQLPLAGVEEALVVTGESPLVDVRSSTIAPTYDDTMIDMAPTASGLWAGVLDHVPGIVSRTDVGGSGAFVQGANQAWGSEFVNTTYSINGADATHSYLGGANGYYSISAFEEVAVSIAAQDIEHRSPGTNINMVIKSGSNDWHFGTKLFYEGEGLVSTNVDAELEEQGVSNGRAVERMTDFDAQSGGPMVRDRAWFFVDYWHYETRQQVLGLEERDRNVLRDITLNVSGQIDRDNDFSGRFIVPYKYRNNRGASRFRPYLGRVQDTRGHTAQLQWQSVLRRNTFLDIRFARTKSIFPLVRRWPPGGDEELAVPSERSATWDYGIGNYIVRPSMPLSEFNTEDVQTRLDGTVSWYVTGGTVSQDVKFGASYQNLSFSNPFTYANGYRAYVDSREDAAGNPGWEPGVPVEVRLYNTPTDWIYDDAWQPNNQFVTAGRALGLFLQDTVTFRNRLTIVGGLRWDYAFNWNPEQTRLDSPWCGREPLANPERFCAETFPEQPRAVTWNNLVPRINVIYDVTGDGRWAVKFNYSRYTERLLMRFVSNLNINDAGYEDWSWDDLNADGIFQFGEHTTFRDARFPVFGTGIDPTLTAPMFNELTFGVDTEIVDNVMIGITGVVRGMNNDTGEVDIGRPFGPMLPAPRCLAECDPDMQTYVDPYDPVMSVDPGNDGIIGTADDGLPVTLWARDPAVALDGNLLATNTPTWGFDDDTEYRGISVVVQKSWAGNWQLLGSYDWGDNRFVSAGTTPSSTYNQRRQESVAARTHLFKLTANYLLAEPVGVNLGVFVRAQSGEPVRAEYTYNNELLEPPNSPFCCQSSQLVYVDARGEGNVVGSGRPEREPFVTIVDVRAEKQVATGGYGMLHFYFDAFNLFNANTVTEFSWTLGPRYGAIEEILLPRTIRLGCGWDF